MLPERHSLPGRYRDKAYGTVTDRVCCRLSSLPSVVQALVPDTEDLEVFLKEESGVKSGTMAMRNDALRETLEKEHHVILLQDSGYLDGVPPCVLTWENMHGDVIAYDIPQDKIEEYRRRSDIIFLSDHFVLNWKMKIDEDVTAVLHASPVRALDTEEGVRGAIAMYPALPVDRLIRSRYGMDPSGKYATVIVSFDEM